MTEADANRYLETMQEQWHYTIRERGSRQIWLSYLELQPPEAVAKAIAHLAKCVERFPSLAEFGEAVVLHRDTDVPALEQGICRTCRDHRFVVYSTRPATQSQWQKERGLESRGSYEEYVPCPDCNSGANTHFRRGDGTVFVGPDPAQIRERLAENATPEASELSEMPEWVKRWQRARAAGDRRPFPEQIPALDDPPKEPIDNREVWVQPDEYQESLVQA